jgi:hypothetical protein
VELLLPYPQPANYTKRFVGTLDNATRWGRTERRPGGRCSLLSVRCRITSDYGKRERPCAKPEQPIALSEPGAQSRPDGLIEIMLRSGVTRRLVGQVDEHAPVA